MSSIYEQIYHQIDCQWEYDRWYQAIINRFGEGIFGDEEGNVYDKDGNWIAGGFELV